MNLYPATKAVILAGGLGTRISEEIHEPIPKIQNAGVEGLPLSGFYSKNRVGHTLVPKKPALEMIFGIGSSESPNR